MLLSPVTVFHAAENFAYIHADRSAKTQTNNKKKKIEEKGKRKGNKTQCLHVPSDSRQ